MLASVATVQNWIFFYLEKIKQYKNKKHTGPKYTPWNAPLRKEEG